MKVEIVYSSLSGCTARVARAIYEGLEGEKSIHDLADGIPELDGEILLLGYWGISGGPCEEVQNFLKTVEHRAVGVFCTLGYYAGTDHAQDTLRAGVDLLKDRNQVIGGFVCNGAIAPNLKNGWDGVPTEQKHLRWEITDSHPTQAECLLAAERFRERVQLYTRCQELGIPFTSVV